jgi:hypothetical protein
MNKQSISDNRRIVIPEPVASDPAALELLSAWAHGGKVSVMTATGTGLDKNPAIWGEILVSIANNVALSVRDATGAEPSETLQTIKAAIERTWRPQPDGFGKHYRPEN